MIVHVVQHVRPALEPDGAEAVKFIGVYSSDAHARAAIERLRVQPGFCDWPDGFHVEPYTLDEDSWTEGFVTVWHPPSPD